MTVDKVDKVDKVGNRKVKSKVDDFVALVNANKSKHFCICSHDNPDPDSIASAFGMQRIVTFSGVENSDLYYCGEISHPQNRAMYNVLDIPLKKWTKEIETDLASRLNDVVFIFVDCVGNQKNMSIPFEPIIAVDHHKAMAGENVLFIHDEVGACSTLIIDLMLNMPANGEGEQSTYCFDHEIDGMRDICTALAIGIKTDTVDFLNETAGDLDYKAYKIVSRYFSDDKFHRIVNYELPPYIFDYEEISWRNRVQDPPNLISGLGFIDQARSDCIPYIADKMMRLQGIQTVVIYAIVGNSIRSSVRTQSSAFDCKDLVQEIFGENNGGAKKGIGGALVELGPFTPTDMDEETKKKLWEITQCHIEAKFKRATEK